MNGEPFIIVGPTKGTKLDEGTRETATNVVISIFPLFLYHFSII